MTVTRRALLTAAATGVAFGARAQGTYPNRVIRIIVPAGPGGPTDVFARLVAQRMSATLGKDVIIENRAGANGTIGAAYVAKSPPDGLTMLIVPAGYAANPALYKALPYDQSKDLAPVSHLASGPLVLVVHPSLPAKNVMEVIAIGKARPGELAFASQGQGTLSHLEQEMLKQMGGFKALHVPYKGSAPGLSDLIPGNVQLFFDSIPSSMPHIKSGRLRAIGVASSKRSPVMPDVPAINESLKGFEADSWFGIMMPAGTPREIVIKFNAEAQKILATQDVKERLLSQGGVPGGGGPEVLAERVKADVAKWGKVAKTAGVKIE